MRIKEIHLLTDDLAGTLAFYSGVLECNRYSQQASELSLILGDTELVFSESAGLLPYYLLAFDIPVNQLNEALHWVNTRVPVLPVPDSGFIAEFTAWNARSFYFYDNNQNVVEFICREDTAHRSEDVFTASSILYASEIGIVTDDVPGLTNQIIERYQLEIFAKQPRQDNFTAIGDDRGLFIMAGTHRNWFPTNKQSRSFPTRVLFESGGRRHELSIDWA